MRPVRVLKLVLRTYDRLLIKFRDMIMKYRYRSQGPWIDVHFKREQWIRDGLDKHVFARLWFNEDGDLEKEPEFFVVEKGST